MLSGSTLSDAAIQNAQALLSEENWENFFLPSI
jgi:hypothetical protein